MPGRSLIGRIAKYGVSPVRDAREDRLTEIWAAIFNSDHCAGFARHVALDWLGSAARDASVADRHRLRALAKMLGQDGSWRCRVETQVPATLEEERRRPDLELTFTGPASVPIWVEVKNGTAPHNEQLFAYGRIQEHLGLKPAAVLLVAPRNTSLRSIPRNFHRTCLASRGRRRPRASEPSLAPATIPCADSYSRSS